MREVVLMAKFEWKAIRSKRWLLLFTIFYAALCIGISYFGSFYAGFGQIQNLRTTGISLMNFSLLFIPLMSLMAGVTSFTDQRDSWEIVCTQPVTIVELLFGKFIGQFVGLTIPIVLGFGAAGIVIAVKGSLYGWLDFLFLFLLNMLTMLVFLSISFFLTTLCKRGHKVFGWVFAVWAILVLFYDMIIIGLEVLSTGMNQKIALWFALFLNPVDMLRILGISQMGQFNAVSATGTLVQSAMQGNGSILLIVAVIVWILVCLYASIALTRRQDLV